MNSVLDFSPIVIGPTSGQDGRTQRSSRTRIVRSSVATERMIVLDGC